MPILHFGAWYDIFIRATIANFTGLSCNAASQKARSSQRLFIGPWMHGPMVSDNFMRRVGELDFGSEAIIDFNQLVQHWFDHWLKGKDNGLANEPPITLFTMGSNTWKKHAQWPPLGVQYVNTICITVLRSGRHLSTMAYSVRRRLQRRNRPTASHTILCNRLEP